MTSTPNTPRDESPSDEVLVDDHRTRELPAGDTPVSEAPAPATASQRPAAPAATATTAPAATATTAPAATATTAPAATATAAPPTPGPAVAPGAGAPAAAQPPYLRGPAPFAIILGLLGLLIASVTLVSEVTDLTVPWDDLGPWTVVAAGIVVLLVGAIGLQASRSQD